MDPLLATLVLLLLALLGARFSFTVDRAGAGPTLLLRTGSHFILIGWALGPWALGLLSQSALTQLHGLMGLGLGWVGLLFGLQLDRESLRSFPLALHLAAFGQAAVAFVLFLAVAASGFSAAGVDLASSGAVLAAVAATACVSTPAGIALVSASFRAGRGAVQDFLFFAASLDALVGVLALQVVYAWARGAGTAGAVSLWGVLAWCGIAAGVGLACAIILIWLMRSRPGRDELVLYLLGISALAAGAALQLRASPIFVSTVMGAVVANFAPDHRRVFHLMERWEKPVYMTLLLLGGALLPVPDARMFVLALAYTVLRGVSKVVAAGGVVAVVPLGFPTPRRLGLALVPQGGIALAMAISLLLTLGRPTTGAIPVADLAFAVIVLGVLASELVGPFLTLQALRRAGETDSAAGA